MVGAFAEAETGPRRRPSSSSARRDPPLTQAGPQVPCVRTSPARESIVRAGCSRMGAYPRSRDVDPYPAQWATATGRRPRRTSDHSRPRALRRERPAQVDLGCSRSAGRARSRRYSPRRTTLPPSFGHRTPVERAAPRRTRTLGSPMWEPRRPGRVAPPSIGPLRPPRTAPPTFQPDQTAVDPQPDLWDEAGRTASPYRLVSRVAVMATPPSVPLRCDPPNGADPTSPRPTSKRDRRGSRSFGVARQVCGPSDAGRGCGRTQT